MSHSRLSSDRTSLDRSQVEHFTKYSLEEAVKIKLMEDEQLSKFKISNLRLKAIKQIFLKKYPNVLYNIIYEFYNRSTGERNHYKPEKKNQFLLLQECEQRAYDIVKTDAIRESEHYVTPYSEEHNKLTRDPNYSSDNLSLEERDLVIGAKLKQRIRQLNIDDEELGGKVQNIENFTQKYVDLFNERLDNFYRPGGARIPYKPNMSKNEIITQTDQDVFKKVIREIIPEYRGGRASRRYKQRRRSSTGRSSKRRSASTRRRKHR